MAKFNIEVELDWMDEEAYSIDDELRERIVKGVENALLEKATNEAVKAVDNKIAEKILEAEGTIQARLLWKLHIRKGQGTDRPIFSTDSRRTKVQHI